MANEKKMNEELEEEYAQLRKNPYFPEKLPIIFNLLALLDVLPQIMTQLITQQSSNLFDESNFIENKNKNFERKKNVHCKPLQKSCRPGWCILFFKCLILIT
jgi:hypothetical protein